MSYRSITKILGESSLERKIRILFGLLLFLLIGGAFWYVSSITETFILESTRRKAQEFASVFLLKTHAGKIDLGDKETLGNINLPIVDDANVEKDEAEMSALIVEGIRPIDNAKVLVVDNEITRLSTTPKEAEDSEKDFLIALAKSLESDQERLDKFSKGEEVNKDEAAALLKEIYTKVRQSDSKFDRFDENDNYIYYEPILFGRQCASACHIPYGPDGKKQKAPIYFVKVSLPYSEAKATISRTRAILMAVAIVTAFVSAVALYLIVRYVIVKPLRHLRDVSEEVIHGDLEMRAELNTGDEFEELSRSFNRMLRHLLDTQNQLSHAKIHLETKVDEQAQLNLKLHEMNRVKSEFLANMSHELRTPLNSIIGFSEVLESAETLNDKQRNYASNIRNAGRNLLEMINDILDLAKLESGRFEVSPAEVNINQMVCELCDLVRPMAEEKRIDIQSKVPEGLPDAVTDAIKVRQILTNLLANAVKFTPDGGRVTVGARRSKDNQLVLTVVDTGVGIPVEDQEVIFEKFRQASSLTGDDNLTREYEGTGLGLSIVRELCHLLGGSVSLESEVGKGSEFKVILPWNLKETGAPASSKQNNGGIGDSHNLPSPSRRQLAHEALMSRSAADNQPAD